MHLANRAPWRSNTVAGLQKMIHRRRKAAPDCKMRCSQLLCMPNWLMKYFQVTQNTVIHVNQLSMTNTDEYMQLRKWEGDYFPAENCSWFTVESIEDRQTRQAQRSGTLDTHKADVFAKHVRMMQPCSVMGNAEKHHESVSIWLLYQGVHWKGFLQYFCHFFPQSFVWKDLNSTICHQMSQTWECTGWCQIQAAFPKGENILSWIYTTTSFLMTTAHTADSNVLWICL